jgi:hypothetical protein
MECLHRREFLCWHILTIDICSFRRNAYHGAHTVIPTIQRLQLKFLPRGFNLGFRVWRYMFKPGEDRSDLLQGWCIQRGSKSCNGRGPARHWGLHRRMHTRYLGWGATAMARQLGLHSGSLQKQLIRTCSSRNVAMGLLLPRQFTSFECWLLIRQGPRPSSLHCLTRLAIVNREDCHSSFRIGVEMQKLWLVKVRALFLSLSWSDNLEYTDYLRWNVERFWA